jgi:hypothetical protein
MPLAILMIQYQDDKPTHEPRMSKMVPDFKRKIDLILPIYSIAATAF